MGRFEVKRGENSMFYRGRGAKALFEKYADRMQGSPVAVDNTSRLIGFVRNTEADDEEEYDD